MTSNPPASYDEPWKLALDLYFEAFLAFFFPDAHLEIDWQRGYESLDQEFQQIVRESEVGKRFVDKLVKVWLLDGKETWLLLHIEVQSQVDSDFAKRMFSYHYRIFDRYDREVVSLAVLGDEQASWRPQEYRYGRWGCELRLKFAIVKLLDYESQWEELEQSSNPFAVMVMAHLKTQTTSQSPQGRFRWKLALIKGLYERGFERQDILELFRSLDWMMRLPDNLELQFREELQRFEEEGEMTYITSVEKIGRQEERREIIEDFLKNRFGQIDEALTHVIEPLAQLPSSEFTSLLLTLSRDELIERFGA